MFHNHNFLQAISSRESEREQARAQEDETRRGYRQKSIRYEVMIAHCTPANPFDLLQVRNTLYYLRLLLWHLACLRSRIN